ncbi:halocyanin [Natronorubrum sp. JWXQ-INN-674]|uniref:Halocyanin n=1 Tax=Natronorubrum halalkaliphilum TaxID=2691917 RepID=A0A6B0VN39_9EURY|nr:plastocyanin/azurin family copper-binding protein [Natronorubrum halalkaliphilum]MXV61979.1 halocyanin [Natronorubrum halalkaliphilum]
MSERRLSRRRLLAVAGNGAALSTAALAGCLGDDNEDDASSNGDNEGSSDDDGTDGNDVVEIETREGDEDGDEPSFVFDPDRVEIEAGTTVRWVNTDGIYHTVTSTDSLEQKTPGDEFDAEIASQGDTFEWTPGEDGVQHYYCKPHAGFMDGTIVVGDAESENADDADDDTDADETDADDATSETIDEEFVDMTGEDGVEIETRAGDGDDEPNFVFDPAFVTVDEGTTIEWVNTDGVFHTVTSTESIDDRSGGGDVFDATIGSEGDIFEWTAEGAGTQPYYCSPHAGFMYGALEIV